MKRRTFFAHAVLPLVCSSLSIAKTLPVANPVSEVNHVYLQNVRIYRDAVKTIPGFENLKSAHITRLNAAVHAAQKNVDQDMVTRWLYNLSAFALDMKGQFDRCKYLSNRWNDFFADAGQRLDKVLQEMQFSGPIVPAKQSRAIYQAKAIPV